VTSTAPARKAGRLQGIVLLPVTLAVMGVIVLVPVVPQMMAHFAYVPGHEYLIQGGVLTMPALFMALSSPAGGGGLQIDLDDVDCSSLPWCVMPWWA